ncbi:MAG TPA: hypothetical protein VL832_18330 [Puia sp.]|jgi:predicted MFS family arabinose efflux permease|nr:hypothetical protein [Puia sp.]
MGSHFSWMLTILLITLMAICLAVWSWADKPNEKMHKKNPDDDE